jgi:ADP-ribosylation factor family
MRILMVGLDAAGKTTILYKLKLGEGMSFLCRILKLRFLVIGCVIFQPPLTNVFSSSRNYNSYHWV